MNLIFNERTQTNRPTTAQHSIHSFNESLTHSGNEREKYVSNIGYHFKIIQYFFQHPACLKFKQW